MTIFGQRLPLWATLVPLLAAIAAYAAWWQGRLHTWRAEVAPWLGASASYGGFPYRLSAEAGPLARTLTGTDTRLALQAARLSVDRQPWRGDLVVLGFAQPRVAMSAVSLAGARATIAAPRGRASVDSAFGHLTRLSAEFADAAITSGLLPALITTSHLEVHLRETPIAPVLLPSGPRMPTQAEAVLRGERARFGGGDPLTLDAHLAITASSPLRSARGWAAGSGTVEVERLTIADRHGLVVDATATIVPEAGTLRVAGALTTVCPRSVLAAMTGRPAPAESRARVPLRIAFVGVVGAVAPLVDASRLGPFTVRAQEPPCPALRR